MRNPLVRQPGKYRNVLDLAVEFRLVDNETVAAAIDQVARMSGLCRLTLKGHDRLDYGHRPNDNDLQLLRGVTGLKRLYLPDYAAVTKAGIAELQQALRSLIIKRA